MGSREMNYEQKYKEVLQKAKEEYNRLGELGNESMKRRFEIIFPELRESEDERMMREFNDWLCEEIECRKNDLRDEEDRRILNMLCYVKDWLEKQKESLHISETCKENANSFTDEDERIRKFLIDILSSGVWKTEWPFSPVDCVAYLEKLQTKIDEAWLRGVADAKKELEKQKEQKPNIELIQRSWYMDGYIDGEFKREPRWNLKAGKGGPKYEENEKYGQPLEQKPAEWSEEDEKMVQFWNMYYEHKVGDWPNKDVVEHLERFKEWLNNRFKSLRPQPKGKWAKRLEEAQARWKPSEEQIEYIAKAIDTLYEEGDCKTAAVLNELRCDLKKLLK